MTSCYVKGKLNLWTIFKLIRESGNTGCPCTVMGLWLEEESVVGV
jgi:hypothetical protein